MIGVANFTEKKAFAQYKAELHNSRFVPLVQVKTHKL